MAALAASSVAQAGVLNFEGSVDVPFMFSGSAATVGEYWIETYGGPRSGDLVGTFIDGSDPDVCWSGGCPVNNPSQYYAGLDDGYFYFGLNDGTNFLLKSLKASFIGAGQEGIPALAGIMVLQGYNAQDQLAGYAELELAGADEFGNFNFDTYDLSSMTNRFAYVLVAAYACDAQGNCNRNTNLANFAIDDIVTVPEPGTLALFGLGMAGLGLASRRRRVR